MYIYRTSQFNEQVERQSSLLAQVNRLCAELETMRVDEVQSRFERLYPYLKRKEGNLRLIACIRRLGNEQILCWLRVFRRGDRQYEEFLRDRENFGIQPLEAQIQDTQLRQWLKTQQAQSGTIQPLVQPLDPNLRFWLDRPGWGEMDTNGVVIYESEVWLRRFQTPEIDQAWETYNRLITEIADGSTSLGEDTAWPGVKLYGKGKQFVLFSRITTADARPQQVLFLLAPFAQPPSTEQIAQVRANWSQNGGLLTPKVKDAGMRGHGEAGMRGGGDAGTRGGGDAGTRGRGETGTSDFVMNESSWGSDEQNFSPEFPNFSGLKLDDLTSIARRAYPSYLLADEYSWRAIENEESSNLALSAEERAILHSVSTSQPSLPLFLNGQAGSGKSTMLFHLFADYCHRHLRHCSQQGQDFFDKPHPLFLAYNQQLLKVAQERVTTLLVSHHRFLAKREELEQLPDLSPFFQSLRKFLWHLLPPEERMRFDDADYISFHRFRQLFAARSWHDVSAERCWLIIRTFIKGYYLDERDVYLPLEDYQEVPKKERTVSEEEFRKIYNSVWRWYEEYTKEEGKWDDQDLIRRVLQLKCYRPEYTAIFCDEAQDFTRLDLQLIMRLSVFSRYDLEHQHGDSLPFAFAGDPLQTLNPTGFRWASLKAAFYNEVLTPLFPTGKLGLEMNFAELDYNYRSIAPIVGVNNLIQLWRQVLFNIPELRPQKARKPGQWEPQKFILSENISPEQLQEYLRDTLIIVPCDQGGERDYLQEDELLKDCLGIRTDAPTPWNVLSAIATKGLEFKQVVLYKFGEACPPNAWERTETPSEELKYFFNKLYVATSRATERLFIVDSPLGEKRLWQQATDKTELDKFLALVSKPKERRNWQQGINTISLGTHPTLMQGDDLLSIAQTFETEGLNTANPELLRRAQGAYHRLDNPYQAKVCEAWALKFEEQFLAAGNRFFEQGKLDEAWDCFWQGMCWQELVNWYEQQELQGAVSRGEGDAGTRGFGDAGMRGHGDAGMRGFGDAGTRGHGDAGMRGFGDAGTRGHGDAGMRGFGDAGTRGHGDAEKGNSTQHFTHPVSSKEQALVRPLVYFMAAEKNDLEAIREFTNFLLNC
ncbi:MAG: hypothetical protein F6K47_31670 [Symploca sp. SIO2E6]|nr:hypothetical protein [Symploca sp. SIO2E6]